MNELKPLLNKRFSVYVGGEYEHSTGFLGLMGLLARWSDFFSYKPNEQRAFIKKSIKEKWVYIDANTSAKISK